MSDGQNRAEARADLTSTSAPDSPTPPPLPPPLPSRHSQPPQSDVQVETLDEPDESGHFVRNAMPWMLSLLIHQAALIALALWVVTGIAGGGGDAASLLASYSVEEDLTDDSILASEAVELEEVTDAPEFDLSEFAEPTAAMEAEVSVQRELVMTEVELAEEMVDPSDLMTELPGRVVRSEVATGGLREATSVEGATGGIVGDILGELSKGNLLVVWLFDQSISLVDDRQRVAAKLAELFEQTEARAAESGHVLQNTAVAFGAQVRQLVPPTEAPQRIVKAVSQVPIDESGMERVFAAITWAAEKYGRRNDARVLIVVWTDESGDDINLLEKTVALCRKRNISVSVVGPSAILGRREGTHSWVHQPTGRVFQLSVMRGPDCALPERLLLPYWWPTRGPDGTGFAFGGNQRQAANFAPWYGGEQLEGLASGMGPYALTRLALETGGTYTIFDRPLDRGPFRLDRMRPYAPDYSSAPLVARDLSYRPIPRAVLQAVGVLAKQSPAMQPSNDYFGRRYQSSAQFRSQLKNALKMEATQAARHLATIETALNAFGSEGLESEYENEPSRRFQAWYDVTRGRLLAAAVRYAEFIQACDLVSRNLNRATNRIVFVPSSELRGASTSRLRAQDADRLLQRCVDKHADTPWAYLAERELDYPFGIDVQQAAIPKPPPRPPTPARPRSGPRPSGGGAITLPKL